MSETGHADEKIHELKNRRGGLKGTITKHLNDIHSAAEAKLNKELNTQREWYNYRYQCIQDVVQHLEANQKTLCELLTIEEERLETVAYLHAVFEAIDKEKEHVDSVFDLCKDDPMISEEVEKNTVPESIQDINAAAAVEPVIDGEPVLGTEHDFIVPEGIQNEADGVGPGDSISRAPSRVTSARSGNSRSSKASSIASSRAKAAARAASLEASAKVLAEIQEVERQALSLSQKKQLLKVEAQLAAANAEKCVYDSLENQTMDSRMGQNRQVMQTPPKLTSPNVKTAQCKSASPKLNPMAAEWPDFGLKPKQSGVYIPDETAMGKTEAKTETNMIELMYSGQRQQQRILDTMTLPKVQLMQFDGDPLKYWLFTRQFDNCVGYEVEDSTKLLMLMQSCTGKARRVIESCAAMEPSYGYVRARELLRERFGNEFVISEMWVNRVADGATLSANDKVGLMDLADDLKNCVENLHAMGYISEVNTQRVLLKIVERLPSFLKNRWIHEAHSIRKRARRNPDIRELMAFVEDAAIEGNDPVYGRLSDRAKNDQGRRQVPGTGRGASFGTSVDCASSSQPAQYEGPPCVLCQDKHTLFGCTKFKGMPVEGRRRCAEENKLCYNCLRKGHGAQKCQLQRTCSVPGCGKKHTKFLHPIVSSDEKPAQSNDNTPNSLESTQAQTMCNATGAGAVMKVALPIIPVKVRPSGGGSTIVVHALLDSGSTNSFSAEQLAVQLNLEGEPTTLSLTTLEKEDSHMETRVVNLEIAAINDDEYIPLNNVFTRSIIPIKDVNIGNPCDIGKWPHLQNLDIPSVDHVNTNGVMLLIGQDHPHILLPRDVRSGNPGEPYATRTMLGWTLSGPLGMTYSQTVHAAMVNFVQTDNTLQEQVERFWKIDDWEAMINEKPSMSVEDRQVVDVWERSIKKDDTGHYVMDIPFRSLPPGLPENRDLAERRLKSLKRRLERDDDLRRSYSDTMQELIDKGHAELVPKELKQTAYETWYLPHQPVFHPKKPGKLRIVFDCAAKCNGISLNDRVMPGPDLTNSLLGVLLRFRQNPVAVMADIEAMFYQVYVSGEQRDVMRFLWWPHGDLDEDPLEYRMTKHLFGGTWSPSCCNFVLRSLAKQNNGSFDEETSRRILRDFYVDDCLSSMPNEDVATAVIADLTEMLRTGGFRLTKWVSNSRNVMAKIPEEERAKDLKGLDLNFEALPTERALGACWNVEDDTFGFSTQVSDKPLTRRGLLSVVSSIFDPMGFLSPFTLRAKKLIQDLTRRQAGWDEQITDDEHKRWIEWKNDLMEIAGMKLPRCWKTKAENEIVKYELHHFSDASNSAYGVVSFLRMMDAKGGYHCSLIMAKSRLAPIKTMSIPRLELTAASLAVKLDGMLRQELDIKIERSVFWTDSTIVLSYINNTRKRFQTYVANRIAVIHQGSTTDQWRHVGSQLNPADDVSRGLSAKGLVESERWKSGPPFLSEAQDKWPRMVDAPSISDEDPEVKKEKVAFSYMAEADTHCKNATDLLIEKYSSWYRLKRGIAWMLRIKSWLLDRIRKQPLGDMKQPLSVTELDSAEIAVVKYVQEQNFGSEMLDASKKCDDKSGKSRPAPRNSLRNLQPMLSNEGLLCVGGRLRKSDLPEVSKHPIILPKRHHIVKLIVRDCHETSGHVGREHVLSLVRETYWIISGRSTVKQILRECFTCKRYFGKPLTQKMADLPSSRVEGGHSPFAYTGVDIFGPIVVKRGRCQVKRYGCLFTCLSIRAIHIEICHSLDTDSFINALHRFMSRRGRPKEIWCDNGTNFVGAERELKRSLTEWNRDKIDSFLLQKGISWHFNPPKASHMGGIWERMIRTTRKILAPLLKDQTVDDEGLLTLMCIVESIINGRPLTTNSDDPQDLAALTPNNLLLPGATTMKAEGTFKKEDLYCRRRWRQVQYLADVFWRRWTREYLPTLQARSKWFGEERNLSIGDVVLIIEESPRSTWPLARVIEVYPGDDRLVRSVKVKTQMTTLVRPVTKLCLLEANE